MKKLTLDQTWEECLRMWEWIAEQIEFYGKLVALNKKRLERKKMNYGVMINGDFLVVCLHLIFIPLLVKICLKTIF